MTDRPKPEEIEAIRNGLKFFSDFRKGERLSRVSRALDTLLREIDWQEAEIEWLQIWEKADKATVTDQQTEIERLRAALENRQIEIERQAARIRELEKAVADLQPKEAEFLNWSKEER